jgi:hypothetical protein
LKLQFQFCLKRVRYRFLRSSQEISKEFLDIEIYGRYIEMNLSRNKQF